MFKFIDSWLEKKLLKNLHEKKTEILKSTLESFKSKHPKMETAELENLLQTEEARIYPMIDESILSERLQRARITFWIVVIVGILMAGIVGGFTSGAALPFIAPIATAFIAWLANLLTIPISYNQRLKGAMNSIVAQYEIQLEQEKSNEKINLTHKQLHEIIEHAIQNTLERKADSFIFSDKKEDHVKLSQSFELEQKTQGNNNQLFIQDNQFEEKSTPSQLKR